MTKNRAIKKKNLNSQSGLVFERLTMYKKDLDNITLIRGRNYGKE